MVEKGGKIISDVNLFKICRVAALTVLFAYILNLIFSFTLSSASKSSIYLVNIIVLLISSLSIVVICIGFIRLAKVNKLNFLRIMAYLLIISILFGNLFWFVYPSDNTILNILINLFAFFIQVPILVLFAISIFALPKKYGTSPKFISILFIIWVSLFLIKFFGVHSIILQQLSVVKDILIALFEIMLFSRLIKDKK